MSAQILFRKFPMRDGAPDPYVEKAVSDTLRHLGHNIPPMQILDEPDSLPAAVSTLIPGMSYGTLYEIGNEIPEGVLERNPPQDLARRLTDSWLLNVADEYQGNLIVGPNKDLYPIDFGFSLYPWPDYEPIWTYNHNVIFGSGLVPPDQPLNKNHLRQLLREEPHIMAILERDLPQRPQGIVGREYPYWRRQALATIRAKFPEIRKRLTMDRPTLADLPTDETPRLPYHPTARGHSDFGIWVHGTRPSREELESQGESGWFDQEGNPLD